MLVYNLLLLISEYKDMMNINNAIKDNCIRLDILEIPANLPEQYREFTCIQLTFNLTVNVAQESLKEELNLPDLINSVYGELFNCEIDPVIKIPCLRYRNNRLSPVRFKPADITYI